MKNLAYIQLIHILKRIVRMMTCLECFLSKHEVCILKSLKNQYVSLLGEEICVPKVIFISLFIAKR